MAIALPSNSVMDTLLRDDRNPAALERLRAMDRANQLAELDDYRVINSDRGPVRGYGGGARRL